MLVRNPVECRRHPDPGVPLHRVTLRPNNPIRHMVFLGTAWVWNSTFPIHPVYFVTHMIVMHRCKSESRHWLVAFVTALV